MLFSIDRIIGKTAHLIGEDRQPLDVPSNMLPHNARAGDMLRYQDGVFIPAPDVAEDRRKVMGEMLAMLLHQRDNGEDN